MSENEDIDSKDFVAVEPEPSQIQQSDEVETYVRKPQCKTCHKVFNSKTGLLNHMRIHIIIRNHKCLLCNEEFTSNDKLIDHKEIHAKEKRSFLCTTCHLAFTDHCDWLVHSISHTRRSLYKCEECQKYFKNKTTYMGHIAIHYDKKLKCEICGQMFRSDTRLNIHMNKHENVYECCECGSTFETKLSLDVHMSDHTGYKPFQCHYCGKGFKSKATRDKHHRTHSDERPFSCKLCNKTFRDQGSIKRHPCEFNKKQYVCDICSKTFRRKETLIPHLKLHSGDLQYKCEYCKRRFVGPVSLRVHMLYKHSDEKPFQCKLEGCDSAFKSKKDLNRHVSQVHKISGID